MIDWTRGYTARWRVCRVDPRTWADGDELPGFVGAKVEHTDQGDAPLIDSGSLELVTDGSGFEIGYYRLTMVAEQGGATERADIATLWCEASGGSFNAGTDTLDIEGRSVLWPASVALMPRGSYAPMGADGASWAAARLREVLAAPVELNGGFTLSSWVVFDDGTSVLEAAWAVLRAGGYTIRIDGDGTVRIGPMPTEPALVLDEARSRLLAPSVAHSIDWSSVPNRYVAIEGTRLAMVINDDPESPTSTASRGYRRDALDTSPSRVNGESLEAYAARKLEEASTVLDVRTYSREWWPGVQCGDIVRGSIATVGMDGDLRVTKQSVECGMGAQVTEEAGMEVVAWRR